MKEVLVGVWASDRVIFEPKYGYDDRSRLIDLLEAIDAATKLGDFELAVALKEYLLEYPTDLIKNVRDSIGDGIEESDTLS